jgi:hypothetical protein
MTTSTQLSLVQSFLRPRRNEFMVVVLGFLLSSLITFAQKPAKSPRDSILFKNGDVLLGGLQSIDAENGVRWTRPDALNESNAFAFAPGHITQLELSSLTRTNPPASSNLCQVLLANGDQLQGDLVSYDGQKLTLNTWFAGTLELPKSAIALIAPLGLPKPTLFAGPTGTEGWTMGKVQAGALVDSGEWIFQNNAFYALKSASIARDVNLPDNASIQFDLEWRGFFHIAVALYTEYLHPINLANKETEPKFGGFYSLQLNPFSANLLPVKQSEALRYLGQASLQALAQTNAAHIDIRASKSKRLIALLINGVLIRHWTDEDFAGTGTALRFVHQGQGAVKLSNLKITEWDGQFEEPITLTPNKTADLARLKNGDRVPGSVKSIRDGKLAIQAATSGQGTTLDIPITRVKQIELSGEKPAPLTHQPSSFPVRAYFASGLGSLTFNLEKWTADELSASSPSFGSAKFKPNAFSRILFDLSSASALPNGAP